MNIDENTSKKISVLSTVAAVLIVCLHVPKTNEMGFQRFVESFVGTYFGAVAVPFFFVVSGFLLGKHTDEAGWYRAALVKRIKTLLLPYLICCVILGSIGNLNSFIANIVHHQPLLR